MTAAPASGTLPRRVARLPRNSSKRRSGLTHASCARLLGAPVATCAPGPRSASARPTSASLGSALVGTATIASSPEPKLDGRSLAECTAGAAGRPLPGGGAPRGGPPPAPAAGAGGGTGGGGPRGGPGGGAGPPPRPGG